MPSLLRALSAPTLGLILVLFAPVDAFAQATRAGDPEPAVTEADVRTTDEGQTDEGESSADPEKGPEDYRGLLSVRIIAGSSRAYPDNSWVFGFGFQGEVELGGVLELVLGAAVLLGENSEVFPFELLLKKTFHLGPEVGLYIALGPLMAVVTEAEHPTQVLFGGTTTLGFIIWQTEEFGLFLEGAYQLLREDGPVHDIEGSVGIAWRF